MGPLTSQDQRRTAWGTPPGPPWDPPGPPGNPPRDPPGSTSRPRRIPEKPTRLGEMHAATKLTIVILTLYYFPSSYVCHSIRLWYHGHPGVKVVQQVVVLAAEDHERQQGAERLPAAYQIDPRFPVSPRDWWRQKLRNLKQGGPCPLRPPKIRRAFGPGRVRACCWYCYHDSTMNYHQIRRAFGSRAC